MKYCIISCLIISFSCFSQNKEILYDFRELPQVLMLNPGSSISFEKHYGIPFLSQVHINAGLTGVTAYDIFKNDGRDVNLKISEALSQISHRDHTSVNSQIEGIYFGWRHNESTYFSAGVYEELDIINYFPKDIATLAWEGNVDYIDRTFDLSHLKFKGELLSVYHFGINKILNNKLTVGARAKLYNSVLNVTSLNNSGSFITRTSTTGNNFYEHIANTDITVKTSGITAFNGSNTTSEYLSKAFTRSIVSGNLGLGLDIGFTYKFDKQWELSGSMLDLGFVYHFANLENYSINGDYNFEGIELVFPQILNGVATNPYWDEFINIIEDEFNINESDASYLTLRPLKLNASLRHNFGTSISEKCYCTQTGNEYQNAVGAQFYSIVRPRGPQMAFSLYYYRQLFDFLRFKTTYTIDPYSFSNIGLGVSTHIGAFNFYGTVNNLLELQNIAKSQSISLQLGFNIIFDQR